MIARALPCKWVLYIGEGYLYHSPFVYSILKARLYQQEPMVTFDINVRVVLLVALPTTNSLFILGDIPMFLFFIK